MPRYTLGIDPAKRRHHASLADRLEATILKRMRFTNDQASLERIHKALAPYRDNVEVRIEATGAYHYPLASHLQDDYPIKYYHPLQLKSERGMGIRKTKSDPIDSATVALTNKRAPKTHYKDAQRLELRELCRWRQTLQEDKGDWDRRLDRAVHLIFPLLSNHRDTYDLHKATMRAVLRKYPSPDAILEAGLEGVRAVMLKASRGQVRPGKAETLVDLARRTLTTRIAPDGIIQQIHDSLDLIEALEPRIRRIETQILKRWEPLRPQHALHTIEGIGDISAATLVGELGRIGEYEDADALVAACGLDPSSKQTGESKPRSGSISKRGSPLARWVLTQAVSAIMMTKSNTVIVEYMQKKLDQGHHWNSAKTAAAKKLTRYVWLVERQHLNDLPQRSS